MTVALILGSWTAMSLAAGLVFGKAVHQADMREPESVS